MRDRMLVIVPTSDATQATQLLESFRSTSIGYATLLMAITKEDRARYPTHAKWLFIEQGLSYGETVMRAIRRYPEYRFYMLGKDTMRWKLPAWDYRIKEHYDDLDDDKAVISLGAGVVASRAILGSPDVWLMGQEELFLHLCNIGESMKRLFAYKFVEEDGDAVLAG
jgi:hypothetical protein